MKKTLKIILIVLAVLAILLCIFAYWQRDNLKALKIAMTYSTDEIAEQMSKQNQDLKKQIETYFPDGIRDFTPEEIEQIKNGKATEQQILAKIIADAASAAVQNGSAEIKIETPEQKKALIDSIVEDVIDILQDTPDLNIKVDRKTLTDVVTNAVSSVLDTAESSNTITTQKGLTENITTAITTSIQETKGITVKESEDTLKKIVTDAVEKSVQSNTGTKNENSPANQQTTNATAGTQQEIIGRYTAKMYALEGQYVAKIEGIISSAYAEYKSMGNGKNNKELQVSIASSYIGQFTALESQCDAEVAALLSQMSAELKAIGADTSIVSTMQNAYESEKAAQRAYYISKYTS